MVKTKNRRNKKGRKTRKYVGGNGELESIKTDKVLYPLLAPFSNKTNLYNVDTLLPNIDLYIATEKKALSEIKKNAIRSVLDQYKSNITQIDTDKYYSNKIDVIYAAIQAKEDAEKAIKDKAAADALKKANSEKAKAAADALKKENAEKAKAAAEALKKAKEDAARIEAERIAKEKSDRKKTEKEEAKRKAREEAERKAKEEAEKKAREEAERKAREEAERKAREEAERKAREEALIAEKEHSVTQTNKSNTKTSTQLEITPRNDYNIMREANKTNELFPLLTNRHINLLLNPKIENSFNSITSNYLSHYNILHISQYLHPEHKNLLKKIHRIEAIILVLVGILNERLENFKIVLKGSKGLQMEFSRIKWRTTVTTDDIDLLIMPVGNYNKADVENIANKLSGLIDALINQIYPSVKEYGIVSEGISVLPKFIAKNPNIVKMSYFFNKKSFAILDIDFKEDTEQFFTEDKIIKTTMDLNQNKVNTTLTYYHQTLDAFVQEKKAIKKKYTDCECPKDVTPPPECEQLCKEKQFMLDKFQKYEPLIQEHENQKKQSNQTPK